MFKKSIKRKWLVDTRKIYNLEQYKYDNIEISYLSQRYDSLTVSVLSVNGGDFKLYLKDGGMKSRNCISYNISEEEYIISKKLAGNKIIKKKRYYVPSSFNSTDTIYVDVFEKHGFVLAEFESDNEILLDILQDEDWFIKEVTDDINFYGQEFVYN